MIHKTFWRIISSCLDHKPLIQFWGSGQERDLVTRCGLSDRVSPSRGWLPLLSPSAHNSNKIAQLK